MGWEEVDLEVRLAAFEFLRREVPLHDHGLLPFRMLEHGFEFRGERICLAGQQGIFKPQLLRDLPLSLRTTPPKPGRPQPYPDEIDPDGSISYCYRGQDADFHENVWLRNACRRRVPLVYLSGVREGLYLASWPAYVIADDPKLRRVLLQVDELAEYGDVALDARGGPRDVARRRYVTATVRRRLHQERFRQGVLRAYRRSCAMCRLRRSELLEASHIVPDAAEGGEPIVANGLSLCDLHHKAFDRNLVSVRPDLRIVVRRDVLDEEDGPVLVHGLKGFHERPLAVIPTDPGDRPDPDRLERRYTEFLAAS
jgi:putative restriction endonuclease